MPPLVKVSTNLSILEHYLYGKNVVRAIDMQNVQKQRTIDDVCNNNGSTSLQEGVVHSFYYFAHFLNSIQAQMINVHSRVCDEITF